MGTGGLYIGSRVDLERFEPLIRGGTGSRSELEEQPDFLPDLCESGTANAVGLAGLGAGVRFVLEQEVENIRRHEEKLTAQLIEGLKAIPSKSSGRCPGVAVYGGHDGARQTATVSFNVAGLEPSEVGLRLDEEYGILCRVGLHCAPSAHKTIGTFPTGTVRFGLSYFNTEEEIEAAVRAVRKLASDFGY
jgi:cysteine desulfurase/selenocysteine lyase